MRVFHSLVFDENIESTTDQFIDASWNAQLGLPDKLTLFAVTDTVSGTSPTLAVQIQESPDQVHWLNKSTAAEIPSTTALSTSANTVAVGRDPGTTPSAAFVRLRIALGGTNPKAHVRVWVTGRGEQIPMGQ